QQPKLIKTDKINTKKKKKKYSTAGQPAMLFVLNKGSYK
ncbi:MAG: hypothetical protein ACI9ES_001919, partial [Oceanospirillaceae bacterium]